MLHSVSPELVLVDPELARAERVRLAEVAQLQAATELGTNGRVADRPPGPMPDELHRMRADERRSQSRWSRERVTKVFLAVSLMTNVTLIAAVVVGSRKDRPGAALQATIQSPSQHSDRSTTTTRRSTPQPAGRFAVLPKGSAAVERKLLALLVRSPAGRLPPALIDRRTGLAKNNLQAVCHAESSRSFLCIVRPARHKRDEGIYVSYRPGRNGSGVFTFKRQRPSRAK